MDFLIHLITEPDHLMWFMGIAALVAGKANKNITGIYAISGLALIVGHALMTGS